MNTPIVPHVFEGNEVRVQLAADGTVWFNANDVCKALELGNARESLSKHVESEDVTKRDTLTAGGIQQTNHINESGLYSLILGSTKDSAKRFKRWVTSEVLPAIRKTGSYQIQQAPVATPSHLQDTVAAMLLVAEAVGKVTGVSPGIAMAHGLNCIQEHTGLPVEKMRLCLPAHEGPVAGLNPTKLAQMIGHNTTPQIVNLMLENLGLQQKSHRGGWELTEAGREYGEMLPYSRHGHAGYQILWNPAVADRLVNGHDTDTGGAWG